MLVRARSGSRVGVCALLLTMAVAITACSRNVGPPAPPADGTPMGGLLLGGDSAVSQASNTWAPAAPLPAPRADHVVAAAGGMVYVVGGRGPGGTAAASTFMYSPSSDRWTERAALPEARMSAMGAAAAANGDLFVFGGRDSSGRYTATTYRFTPASNRWTQRASVPAPGGCGGAAASDTLIFVFAGCDSAGAPARHFYSYNPGADTFQELPSPSAEHQYGALVAARGELHLLGGKTGTDSAIAIVERFSPSAGTWSRARAMRVARFGHGAVFVRQSLVVAGGATTAAEYLDIARTTWSPRASAPVVHHRAGAAVVGSRVVVAGGLDASGEPQARVDVLVHGDFWLQARPMPTPREATVAGELDGVIYVAGGYQGRAGLVTVNEAFDVRTATWKTMAPVPGLRGHAMGAVAGGKFYVIGGNFKSPPNRTPTNSVLAYDPATDTWTEKQPMPTAGAWGGTAAVIDNVIYVTPGLTTGEVYAYDVSKDAWSTVPELSGRSRGASGAAIDGKLYLAGGKGTWLPKDDLRVFDLAARAWTDGPDVPRAVAFPTTTAVRGMLYVIGGGNIESYAQPLTQRYDPVANRWSQATPMPEGVVSTASAESGGVIYVFGGKTVRKKVTGNVFAYVP